MTHKLAAIAFSDVWTIISFVYTLFVVATVAVLIADRREPVKTLAWIMVITMFPVGGMILFVALGQNHRKQRTFARKELMDAHTLESLAQQQLRTLAEYQEHISAQDRQFAHLMIKNSNALLTLHNRVKILNNGSETFPAMFEAMRQAERYIHIEFFAIEGGKLFDQMAEVLIERARAGVEVRIIYDSVGSRALKKRDIERLTSEGIEVRSFMPVFFTRFTSMINYRNHRKVVVVDGRVAFTGGVNIADRYINGRHGGIWRDTHLKVEGEAVMMLQTVFINDWSFVTDGQLLDAPDYFQTVEVEESTPMQIATSGPDSAYASIMQAYFAAIGKAKNYIYVSTPYLMPNESILTALKVAALSGVDVRVLIPVRGDNIFVAWAGYSYIDDLMAAGVKVYLYKLGFNHSKFVVIDDELCAIGSANLDNRSFNDDFEVQAIIYENAVAKDLKEHFLADIEQSRLVTPDWWEQRSRLSKVMEPISRLLSPLF